MISSKFTIDEHAHLNVVKTNARTRTRVKLSDCA